VTVATIPLFLRLDLKRENLIQSLEKRQCCDSKDRGISERRAFEYYTIRVWLKVCPIYLWILISMNIAYMVSRIG
jgi:hypothetical protein